MAAPRITFCPTNEELVALLPRLHAGEVIPFVHRADVYSAAPADLVGNFVPAPGTDKGAVHGRVWYLLCPKKHKRGDRRVRTIDGADNGCYWRGEAGPKKVESLVDGYPVVGYFSTFSYGYKTPTPERRFMRLGWCMVEYFLDDARYDHVLCKVYRSPRAKASSRNSAVLPSSSGSERKVAGGDHQEASPTRLRPPQVQENRLAHDAPMMHVQVQHGYVHEGPQPGAGAVHGGDTAGLLIGSGISMEDEQAGIDYEQLLSDLLSQIDDYPCFDDILFGPN